MAEMDDMQLLKEYAASNSEAAFAALVQRHINLVYSVALRHVRDGHKAQDVTQAVFIILAQKAAHLKNETVLTGWLYQTARHVSASFLRGEMRRQRREQESFMESTLDHTQTEAAWESLSPILDAAMGRLGKTDRDAILLRFFEGKSVTETALALNINEPAAKKRVTRALEKLRKFFTKRGITLSATALATTVATNSVQAAPATLTKAITAVAITKGTTASISTLTLIQGALKIMAWTKAKTTIVVGLGVLLAAGTTTITIKEIQKPSYPVHIAEMAERLTPPQFGLQVGPSLLGWSVRANSFSVRNGLNYPSSERNGYIYMRDVRPGGGNKPLWEFALTTKRQLSDVTRDDLRCEFYGTDDPRGADVFGAAWNGETIIVPEGQIIFARLIADHSVVYVIRLAKQGKTSKGDATMQIEYREFTGQPL